MWKSMTEEEKAPFIKSAEKDKRLHMKLYPDYIYAPVSKKKKQRLPKTNVKSHDLCLVYDANDTDMNYLDRVENTTDFME